MKKKRKINIKGSLELPRITSYFRDLSTSFEAGILCISNTNEFITLKPEGFIEITIEAKRKNNKEKLCLELSWNKEEKEKTNNNIELKIFSTESNPSGAVKKDIPIKATGNYKKTIEPEVPKQVEKALPTEKITRNKKTTEPEIPKRREKSLPVEKTKKHTGKKVKRTKKRRPITSR